MLPKRHFEINEQKEYIRFFLTIFSFCFLQANKACKTLGSSTVASIEDKTANNFIKGKLSANSWIGGTDSKKVS